VRDFAGDVRSSMLEREAELREGTGMDGSGTAEPATPAPTHGEADHR
jgi:hypothetical protein